MCLKIVFWQLWVTVCGNEFPNTFRGGRINGWENRCSADKECVAQRTDGIKDEGFMEIQMAQNIGSMSDMSAGVSG